MAYLLNAYLNTTATVDLLNLTHDVKRAVRESQVKNGLLTALIPSSTAGLVVLENDPEIQEAFKKSILERIDSPTGVRPVRKSGTGHVQSHLQAAQLQTSISIPIVEGVLILGPWQEVLVIDFDDKVGRREIKIHVMGEAEKK
jgi:secondary thiamine-phosphate synthase enzyme